MLPAERTHYRRGLALGLTVAEIFTIIVFILLLASALLLSQERKEADDKLSQERKEADDKFQSVDEELQSVRVDYAVAKAMLEPEVPSGGTTEGWIRRYRAMTDSLARIKGRIQALKADSARIHAEKQLLLDSLAADSPTSELGEKAALQVRVTSLKESQANLNDSLSAAEDSIERLEQELERVKDKYRLARTALADDGSVQDDHVDDILAKAGRTDSLEDALENARDTIASLDEQLKRWEDVDEETEIDLLRNAAARKTARVADLQRELESVRRQRDETVARAEFREAEVQGLRGGLGIDPPPCWLDDNNDPEYIFRIEIANSGMRVFDTVPKHRKDDSVVDYVSDFRDGVTYSPEEFQRLAQPIYDAGTRRKETFGPAGCRFWITPVDRTGDQKATFQERERQVWRLFWFRW